MEPFKVICISEDTNPFPGCCAAKKGNVYTVIEICTLASTFWKGDWYRLKEIDESDIHHHSLFRRIADATSSLTKELAEKAMIIGDGVEQVKEIETVNN